MPVISIHEVLAFFYSDRPSQSEISSKGRSPNSLTLELYLHAFSC
ncbi:hypothetical protein V2H45_22380 [Tumidithrix elongata RA019]|uniref:Uncharacterized protein n=1 Tax=Tumidithrix elongata BACA0141 TaxID=2716417 RepID=A0AAW9PWT9_9CYAN|nr:hypothetical protein [Tumidithrix elongata RA019]